MTAVGAAAARFITCTGPVLQGTPAGGSSTGGQPPPPPPSDPTDHHQHHRHPPTPTPTPAGSSDEYAPWEVRALVLALLPPAGSGVRAAPAKEVLYQLPSVAQRQLRRHEGGLVAYCQHHFGGDVVVVVAAAAAAADGSGGGGLYRKAHTIDNSSGSALGGHDASGRDSHGSGPTTLVEAHRPASMAPPPPPVAVGSHVGIGGFGSSSSDGSGGSGIPTRTFVPGKQYTTIELLDALVEYLPTFFVTADSVAVTIPSDIQRLYAETSFAFFMKRFRHYVDLRTTHGHSELRLRPDFDHPRRGLADEHHDGGMSRGGRGGGGGGGRGFGSSATPPSSSSSSGTATATGAAAGHAAVMLSGLARPPRNSEANLVQYIVPRMPKAYTPLAEVLQDISDIVARHPSFDPRLGVTGLLERHPEYFQMVDGKLRARPHKSAPNSLDDLDGASSPLPEVFAKILLLVDAAAEGKNYLDVADKAAAPVPTGKLYARLSAAEKKLVKDRCRSFPRFLRLHGRSIVVSPDSMRVYRFKPEYEPCAETILDRRLAMHAIDPDDPILKIPAEMADAANADWAVKELYDALPLTQCAELADLLSLVPPAVRDALPADLAAIVTEVLDSFPDYFTSWRYPDDETVIVLQRAGVQTPSFETLDIVRMTFPIIPQGGMELEALRRRVPLPLQRYFYRHGMRCTLNGLPQHFRIAGERIIRMG